MAEGLALSVGGGQNLVVKPLPIAKERKYLETIHLGLKDLDTRNFVHSFSSVFISFEERNRGKFFVAFFASATEKLSGTFC